MNQFGIMVGRDRPDSFEGWFSKIDDKENDLMLSVIWGYSTHRDTSHAFIQFTESRDNRTSYIRYAMEEMSWVEEPFELHIGKNVLSAKGMKLDLEVQGRSVQGDFTFGEFTPIRTSFLKPNIMGWLTRFPNECNHSITSMHHRVDGSLRIGEREWKVREAAGYMEKDWGRSFPREYVWAHANGWEKSSFVFSYATVPVLGRFAKGFFLVIHHEGEEYRFSSIEGSRMLHFKVTDDAFVAIIGKGVYRAVIKARQAHPLELASPSFGEMSQKIKESLDGKAEVMLLKGDEVLLDLKTRRASIDVHF